jgi:hypothetical protein
MSLPNDVSRCEGRQGRSAVGATLCAECIKCLRRTSRPEGAQLSFMQPPALLWIGTCSGFRGEWEAEVDVV